MGVRRGLLRGEWIALGEGSGEKGTRSGGNGICSRAHAAGKRAHGALVKEGTRTHNSSASPRPNLVHQVKQARTLQENKNGSGRGWSIPRAPKRVPKARERSKMSMNPLIGVRVNPTGRFICDKGP